MVCSTTHHGTVESRVVIPLVDSSDQNISAPLVSSHPAPTLPHLPFQTLNTPNPHRLLPDTLTHSLTRRTNQPPVQLPCSRRRLPLPVPVLRSRHRRLPVFRIHRWGHNPDHHRGRSPRHLTHVQQLGLSSSSWCALCNRGIELRELDLRDGRCLLELRCSSGARGLLPGLPGD